MDLKTSRNSALAYAFRVTRAWLAIGHALWMSELIKSQSSFFFHDHHFWLNHINSVTLLGMALDRLRDLFLVAWNPAFTNIPSPMRRLRRAFLGSSPTWKSYLIWRERSTIAAKAGTRQCMISQQRRLSL